VAIDARDTGGDTGQTVSSEKSETLDRSLEARAKASGHPGLRIVKETKVSLRNRRTLTIKLGKVGVWNGEPLEHIGGGTGEKITITPHYWGSSMSVFYHLDPLTKPVDVAVRTVVRENNSNIDLSVPSRSFQTIGDFTITEGVGCVEDEGPNCLAPDHRSVIERWIYVQGELVVRVEVTLSKTSATFRLLPI